MKKVHIFYTLFLVSALLFLTPVIGPAQENGEPASEEEEVRLVPDRPVPASITVIKGTDLIGYQVVDSDGDEIGAVAGLLLDAGGARVSYLVVHLGRIEGADDLFVPVPLRASAMDPATDTFMVGVQRDILESAPTLTPQELPENFVESVRSEQRRYMFWTQEGVYTPPDEFIPLAGEPAPLYHSAGMHIVPGSRTTLQALKGAAVVNDSGEEIGTIHDIMVNLATSEIKYLLASFEKHGSTVFPLTLDLFTLNWMEETFQFDPASELLDRAPVLDPDADPDSWPDTKNIAGYWRKRYTPVALRNGMRIIPSEAMRMTEITGYDVVNRRGDVLGELEDFVVAKNGSIPYAVVDAGVFDNLDYEWYYVPLEALTFDRLYLQVYLDVYDIDLENQPGFGTGSPPDMSDPQWDREVRDYWGRVPETIPGDGPAGTETAGAGEGAPETGEPDEGAPEQTAGEAMAAEPESDRFFHASTLLESPIVTAGEENAGTIEDLMLDIEGARVRYAVLSVGGFLGMGDKLLEVPVIALQVDEQENRVLLKADHDKLEQAPGFSAHTWPEKIDLDRAEERKQFWNENRQ
jgi:sporulation protein YlmC with PRC-barrel domain